MNKKFIAVFSVSLSLLTACGQEIASPTLQEIEETTIAAVTETTEAVTTAKSSEADINNACKTPPVDLKIEITDSIEVYDDVAFADVISNSEIELVDDEYMIATDEIGKQKANITYYYNDTLYHHPVEYEVVDTTPPVLLNSGAGSSIELYTDFDINDYVGFADNYDSDPMLEYSGYVDTTVCDTYYLTATATDKSGNETSWELDITVTDTIPEPVDDNERIQFEDYVQKYAGDDVSFGIDISRWQGDVDFEAVKNAGCEFVIMRIGSYYDEYTLDSCFIQNFEGARKAGLDVGVYIYTTANTEDEIRENAKWVAENLNGEKLDLPVVFDWEEFYNFQQYDMSINDLNRYFEIFAEEIEHEGMEAMLYSSKNFLCNFWYEQEDYPVWLAHYIDETTYEGEYAMWQSTCFGKIDGIEGDVDFNIMYKNKMN